MESIKTIQSVENSRFSKPWSKSDLEKLEESRYELKKSSAPTVSQKNPKKNDPRINVLKKNLDRSIEINKKARPQRLNNLDASPASDSVPHLSVIIGKDVDPASFCYDLSASPALDCQPKVENTETPKDTEVKIVTSEKKRHSKAHKLTQSEATHALKKGTFSLNQYKHS